MRSMALLSLALLTASPAAALTIHPPTCNEAGGTQWNIDYKFAADQFLASRYASEDGREEHRLVMCSARRSTLSVLSGDLRVEDRPNPDAIDWILAAVLSPEVVPVAALLARLRAEGFDARTIAYPSDGCVCDAETALVDLTDPRERTLWSENIAQRVPEGAF
jgi:hypothetical protein